MKHNVHDRNVRYLAYDVRGLLACVQLQVDGLARHPQDDVRKRVMTLQRAIDRIIDYCASTPPDVVEPVYRINTCLRTVLDDVGAFLRPAGRMAAVEIRIEADPASLTISEASAIHRILMNLGRNAISAMCRKSGTCLSIKATSGGKALRIDVEDDGPGLPAAMLRSPVSASRLPFPTSHQGLGLSSARYLAATLGGTLGLLRSGTEGAVFRIVIPRPAAQQFVPRNPWQVRQSATKGRLSEGGRPSTEDRLSSE
jgi:signal transduction histidine kinase